MANFSSILDMPSSDVKFSKLPVGSYVGIVKGMPRYDKSTKKQSPFVEFIVQISEAMDDVDPDDLKEFDESPAGPAVGKELPLSFYYETEGGYNRLKAFLDNCGVEDYKNLRAGNEEAPGRTIIVQIKHEASTDGQSYYARIDGTAKYGG